MSLLLLLGAGLSHSLPFLLSVFYGVIIGAANFVFLVWIIEGWLSGRQIKKRKILVSVAGKGLLLLVIIGLILEKGHVTPLPLLLGLSNVFLGIFTYGVKDWMFPSDEEG